MTLQEALAQGNHPEAYKREERGWHTVSAANFSGGYYVDFIADHPSHPFATSQHYSSDELSRRFDANEDEWRVGHPTIEQRIAAR